MKSLWLKSRRPKAVGPEAAQFEAEGGQLDSADSCCADIDNPSAISEVPLPKITDG